MVGKRQLYKLVKVEKEKNLLMLASCSRSSRTDNLSDRTEDTESSFDINNEELLPSLPDNLRNWYKKYRPTVKCTVAVLKILNPLHPEIPISVATLLGRKCELVKRTVSPGSYFHLGIEQNLRKIDEQLIGQKIDTIILDIGIDGLPLYKSSDVGLWPLLGRVVNMSNIKVVLIGCYVGKKPSNID